jgi:hypothetical protein
MTTLELSRQIDWLATELALMSSAEDSLAKTSAPQGKAQDLPENGQGCGGSSTGSSRRSSRSGSSLKTSLPFALKDWTQFSGASLRSGTMRSGIVYPLPPLAPLTAGIESGLWPTPDASPHKYRLRGNSQQSRSLNGIHGGKLNPTWVEWLMGFPLGHTDLKPSEMPSFRKSRKSLEK